MNGCFEFSSTPRPKGLIEGDVPAGRERLTMNRLTSDQVLEESKASDAPSVTSLKLNQKALTDVSCLTDFRKLERLDLGFNNLVSLEDLRSCVHLKWLSVVQNKLQSLKGVEALSKLTVLNAGKNKLSSMDEVQSLVGIRALILNDNGIRSICMLDGMKELNTLVLSRNPIRNIGKSLVKVKCLTKLSLSNCELDDIGSSLKSCIELKELRLAHNNIKTLPAELMQNVKLQSVDLGNNLITRRSDLKVLKALSNMRNLNLLGNPIVENEKSAEKIRKALPNLQVFNAKPVNKSSKNLEHGVKGVDDFSLEKNVQEVKLIDRIEVKTKPKRPLEDRADKDDDSDLKKERKWKHHNNPQGALPKKDKQVPKQVGEPVEKKAKRKAKEVNSEIDIIDDAEIAFSDLFESGESDLPARGMERPEEINKLLKKSSSLAGPATFSSSRKKSKKSSFDLSLLGYSTVEVGMGGPSSWEDD
ncbi:hypothetical protein SAY86_002605 [Trapa natans]|uniref:Uncharacterized protein n=1 Tax=Trapa natans TaxID=22666 RepID=A0AAN7LTU1_TRANT|nr:hypothetical protein SAY86_002605 [Trapa natans]